MDQLVQEIAQRTGMSEDQVRPVCEATIQYLKEKMPEPGPGLIDQVLGGGVEAAKGFFNR